MLFSGLLSLPAILQVFLPTVFRNVTIDPLATGAREGIQAGIVGNRRMALIGSACKIYRFFNFGKKTCRIRRYNPFRQYRLFSVIQVG